jgi:SAM-dependent methyltransferase
LFFDIGGGNGFVAKGIEEKGITTILIEPGINGSLNAKKRGLKNIVCSTLEEAAIRKASIPSIGLFDVVEHIEDDKKFLKLIYDYLKPNGYVFITVPAFKFLWSNEDDEAGHFRRYTTTEIEEKLHSIGFKIKYSTYIFSVLPIAVFFFRTIPYWLKFKQNKAGLEKHSNQHKNKGGLLSIILNKIWNYELNRIKKSRRIIVGGSCFIVAQKA